MATQTLTTFDEFLALPEQEGVVRELDEGVVIEMPGASLPHGVVQVTAGRLLESHVIQTGAQFHVSANTPFRLAPDTVRIPDVCLVRISSYRAMDMVRGVPRGAPDLAVEVVSPNDNAADLDRKVEQFLLAGTTAVWVLYSATRHVLIHRRSGEIRKYSSGQTIEEPELLPGLAIAVEELFHGVTF